MEGLRHGLQKVCDATDAAKANPSLEVQIHCAVDELCDAIQRDVDFFWRCAQEIAANVRKGGEGPSSEARMVADCHFVLALPERVANAAHSCLREELGEGTYHAQVARQVFTEAALRELPSDSQLSSVMLTLVSGLVARGHSAELASALSCVVRSCHVELLDIIATHMLLRVVSPRVIGPMLTHLIHEATRRAGLFDQLHALFMCLFGKRAPPANSAAEGSEEEATIVISQAAWGRELFLVHFTSKALPRKALKFIVSLALALEERKWVIPALKGQTAQPFLSLQREVLHAWANASFVQLADVPHLQSLTDAVMYVMLHTSKSALTNDSTETPPSQPPTEKEEKGLLADLLNGIQVRMSSPVKEIRKMAALLAVQMSRVMDTKGDPLVFDEFPQIVGNWMKEDAPEVVATGSSSSSPAQKRVTRKKRRNVAALSRVAEIDPDAAVVFGFSSGDEEYEVAEGTIKCDDSGIVCVQGPQPSSDQPASSSVFPRNEVEENVDNDDDDDDPTVAARREAVAALPHFKFVKDALAAIRSTTDYDQSEGGLLDLPRLLATAPQDEIRSLVQEVFLTLLNAGPVNELLANTVANARSESMVLLVQRCPVEAARALSTMMYSHNYSMCQRIELFQCIRTACERMSKEELNAFDPNSPSKQQPAAKRVYPPIPLSDVVQRPRAADEKIISRIEGKTRRWGSTAHASTRSHSYRNRLADVADAILSELLRLYDKDHYKLLEDDTFVGVELLRTVTVLFESLKLARHILHQLCPRVVPFLLEVATKSPHCVVRSNAWLAVEAVFSVWRRPDDVEWVSLASTVVPIATKAATSEEDLTCRACASSAAGCIVSLMQGALDEFVAEKRPSAIITEIG